MKTRIALIRTTERRAGIERAIDLLQMNPVRGLRVLVKPNFNTADPFPASTHNDTLDSLLGKLRSMGAKELTVADRSGPANTADVLIAKGVGALCRTHDAQVLNFEAMPDAHWQHMQPEGSHWRSGFYFARPVLEAEAVVTTCCLKTHGYGGGITMSLKLSVGMVHGRNMTELHTSLRSQRKMIAEVNVPYTPALVIMDGILAFTDKGPMSGPVAETGIIVAGTDRVAVDAVGMAALKHAGSNRHIMQTRVFEQEQIARAIELGLGARNVEEIEFLTDDAQSAQHAKVLAELMK